ncbi:esterase/lipase family protein [Methanoregula sp.]|jgi:triacylglycerol lipase|uniref:esterase/lipase family protein n=1 Tax=Methanoregula sp. TaxID=2052170 RepID=UPI003C22D780
MKECAKGRVPVVLIHGWNSHPGIWNRLDPLLAGVSIPVWKFDHSAMRESAVPEIAEALESFIRAMRNREGYGGPVDIVCHSIGSCIARYFLEVQDGTVKGESVRQLICLGPPNNGSALAELFNDPCRKEEIIGQLSEIFVPVGYDPGSDPLVQDVRPGSTVMQHLRAAGTRPDIIYRIIVTTNIHEDPAFFPWFLGKTWEYAGGETYRTTFAGDGIVAHTESCLPGISPVVITSGKENQNPALSPARYCHINLPRNPAVMERILQYLVMPGT